MSGEHLVRGGRVGVVLDGLRRDRASVALKAVLTEHNVHWTAARLRRELAAENEALRRAAGKSVHSGGSR